MLKRQVTDIVVNESTALGDYIVAMAAALLLLLYFLIKTKNSNRKQNHSPRHPRDLWRVSKIESYSTTTKFAGDRWTIHFSTASIVSETTTFDRHDDFFLIGENSTHADFITAPLVRKMLLKYRDSYEHARPIHITRASSSQPLYSWLQSESQMRQVLFQFLDEGLLIANALSSQPMLTIDWCQKLLFTISFSIEQDVASVLAGKLANEHAELGVKYENGRLEFNLWLAFQREERPHNLRDRTSSLTAKLPKAG